MDAAFSERLLTTVEPNVSTELIECQKLTVKLHIHVYIWHRHPRIHLKILNLLTFMRKVCGLCVSPFRSPWEHLILRLGPLLPALCRPVIPLPLRLVPPPPPPPPGRGHEASAHPMPSPLSDHHTVVLTSHPHLEEAQEKTTMTGVKEMYTIILDWGNVYIECFLFCSLRGSLVMCSA